MPVTAKDQPSRLFLLPKTDLYLQELLAEPQARNLAPKTLAWCRDSLGNLLGLPTSRGSAFVESAGPTTPELLLLALAKTHNSRGARGVYSVGRALLRWYEGENSPLGRVNPVKRARAPKAPEASMEPVGLGHLRKMLAKCKGRTLTGDRDWAIILGLLDTDCWTRSEKPPMLKQT